MPAVTLPDGEIQYRDLGEPDAPAVVFVHGVLVNGLLWRDVAERVAGAGLRAIVPDWPLGSHPTPMGPGADLTPRGVAAMAVAFLERLDLTDVCLVANDTGGAIVQMALAGNPSRVGRAVFTNCDTFDRFPPPPFDRMFRAARLPGLLPMSFAFTRIGPLARMGYKPLVSGPVDPALAAAWARPGTRKAIRADLRRFLGAVDPADLVEASTHLGEFAGDVLVAWGADDPYFRIEDGRRLAECFRSARVVEIPGSRTFVALDQPAALADEITAFVPAPRRQGATG